MKKQQNEILDEFREKCKRHNLKITPQRVALYKLVLKAESHPPATEVYEEVSKEFENISFDTVNRTLNTFAEMGLVSVVEGHGAPRRFDPNTRQHHHAHCLRCGRIMDFENRAYDALAIPAAVKKEFIIENKRVVLDGLCKECSGKD